MRQPKLTNTLLLFWHFTEKEVAFFFPSPNVKKVMNETLGEEK